MLLSWYMNCQNVNQKCQSRGGGSDGAPLPARSATLQLRFVFENLCTKQARSSKFFIFVRPPQLKICSAGPEYHNEYIFGYRIDTFALPVYVVFLLSSKYVFSVH